MQPFFGLLTFSLIGVDCAFFAVACEAFFVDRARFALEFPTLAPLLAALFKPATSQS